MILNPNRAIKNHGTDSSSQPSSSIQKPVKSIIAEDAPRPKCRSNLAAKSLRSTYSSSSERPKRFEPGRISKQSTLTDLKLRPIPGDPLLKPMEPLQRLQGRYIRQAHKDHTEPCIQTKMSRPTVKSKSTVEVSSTQKHAAKVKQLSSIAALTAIQDESSAQTSSTKAIARTQTPFVRRSRTLGKMTELSDETSNCVKCLEYRQNIAVLTLAIRKLQRQGQKMVAMLKNKENVINQLKTELSQIMLQSQPIGTITKSCTSTVQTTDTENATLSEMPVGPNPSLQEVSDHVESDLLKVQLHQARIDLQELQNFLANLLYTLNTRGYESITDQFGNSIDLSRCKGNQLLELKGQDGRRMLSMNRTSVHENALKAFIGSQEQLIQQLMCQLNDMQRYCHVHEKPANSDARSMKIDGDIFNLTTLLEATCHHVPDQLLDNLLEEQQESSKGVDQDQGDVVDIVLPDDYKTDSDKVDTGCS